jgi:hypothetical protein
VDKLANFLILGVLVLIRSSLWEYSQEVSSVSIERKGERDGIILKIEWAYSMGEPG